MKKAYVQSLHRELRPPGNSVQMRRQREQLGKDLDRNFKDVRTHSQTLCVIPAPYGRVPTMTGVENA